MSEELKYQVQVWDYDPEGGYFLHHRRSFPDLERAKSYAFGEADTVEGIYVGAGVYDSERTCVASYGFVPEGFVS